MARRRDDTVTFAMAQTLTPAQIGCAEKSIERLVEDIVRKMAHDMRPYGVRINDCNLKLEMVAVYDEANKDRN